MVDMDALVCGTCGLLIGPGQGGNYFHVEEPPEGWESHDVTIVTTRKEYLFDNEPSAPPVERSVGAQERQARALERIASALERLLMDTKD